MKSLYKSSLKFGNSILNVFCAKTPKVFSCCINSIFIMLIDAVLFVISSCIGWSEFMCFLNKLICVISLLLK